MERCRAQFDTFNPVCVVAHGGPRRDRRERIHRSSASRESPVARSRPASDADSADLTNAAAITSPAATGATSPITHAGLWTALTGGIFLGSHPLTTAVTLALGEKIRIPAGDLDLSFPIA